jgi:hypothetical protein
MKNISAFRYSFFVLFPMRNKPTRTKTPSRKFNLAKEYFAKEQYNLAYPILKELRASLRETDRLNNARAGTGIGVLHDGSAH